MDTRTDFDPGVDLRPTSLSTKPQSKADTTNPKDLIGNTKVSLSKVPVLAVAHCAMAMMDGAEKYGPFNWRDKEVVAHIYIDAAKRHLDCWFEGQELASDSKVHHLGHAMACCAILLDAQSKGKLVDDRPKDDADLDFLERQLAELSEVVKRKQEEKKAAATEKTTTQATPPRCGESKLPSRLLGHWYCTRSHGHSGPCSAVQVRGL